MSHFSTGNSLVCRRRSRKLHRRRRIIEQLEQRQLLAVGDDPVVIVPGFASTFADITSPGLSESEINDRLDRWYTHRGLHPDELFLEPHGKVYQSLVQTLENVGYVQGENLFVVTWDWRTPVAPLDADSESSPDGQLGDVTAASITDDVFETGLDYLGFMLKRIADNHLANTGETLETVDVITHSTGGLITRAYVQSPAYGDGLPTISDFIMSGTPNLGVVDAFNVANDDWNVNIAGRAATRLVDHAYDRMVSGTRIDGPLNGDQPGPDDINDPGIDKETFVRSYVASLNALLPTYPVIDTDGDGEFEVPSGSHVNHLMNDLNAGADPNAFVERTELTIMHYSTEVETRDLLIEQTGPHPDGFTTDEILSFTNYIGRRPEEGEIWYQALTSPHKGDDTVATFSSIDPFLGDPRIGSKIKLEPITAANSGGEPVSHAGLVNNKYSQSTILNNIGASGFTDADIEDSLSFNTFETLIHGIRFDIINPVEAINEAASRFGDLLVDALNTGLLQAEMAFTGLKLGERLRVDQLWQDKIVTPLTNLLATNPDADENEIAEALGAKVTNVSDANELALRFDFDASDLSGPLTSDHALDLGPGYVLTAGGDFTFTGDLSFSGTFGIDRSKGLKLNEGLFVKDVELSMGGSADVQDLDLGVTVGGISAGIEGGSFRMQDVGVDVSLNDLNGDGRISLDEVGQGLDDLPNFISLAPRGGVDLKLPLTVSDSASQFDSTKFGTPVISASSENLFAGAADVLVDMELSRALQDQILSILSSLDENADRLGSSSFFNQSIPGVGESLNGLLGTDGSGEARKWTDLLKLEHAAIDYFGRFDPASGNFDPETIGESATALGLRDALAAAIQLASGFTGNNGNPPIQIEGGVDLATNQLRFSLVADATLARQVDLDFDGLGSQWTELGIDLKADATAQVETTVDMGLEFGIGLDQEVGIDPYFDLQRFNVDLALDGAGSSFGFNIGPIEGAITANQLDIETGIEIALPAGAGSLRDRFMVRPKAASPGNPQLNLDFDFAASLYGTPLGPAAPNLPSIQVTDADLFVNPAPEFTIDLQPLIMNLSAEHVVDGLLALASWLDEVTETDAMNVTIPLVNKTVGEILSAPAEPREFTAGEIIGMTGPVVDGDVQTFTVTLNTGGAGAASLGIKPFVERSGADDAQTASEDIVTFLAESGDRFTAKVDSIDGETVTLRYPASRADKPDLVNPSLEFLVGGSIGDQLKSALVNYNKPGQAAASIGQLFNEIGGPLGIDFGSIQFDESTKTLTLTPSFQPEPIKFETALDFGENIPGLAFEASGNFLIEAAPEIRLPIGIVLDPDTSIAATDRVFVVEDVEPEVKVSLTANLDDPRARASIGFLSAVLAEDGTLATNDGITFTTNVDLNVNEPASGNSDGHATITEITSDVGGSFTPAFAGSFDIDGLTIRPEAAGATIPGEVQIFTTTDGTNRGPATFSSFGELAGLFGRIEIQNTIGTYDSLTPESVVTMFIELGNSLQEVTKELDVPEGIPFVDDAISELVQFIDVTGDLARRLYFNAAVVSDNDISVTDGVLSSDATFFISVENSNPRVVTVTADTTVDNQSIDDLYADINAAIATAGLSEAILAERRKPLDSTQLDTIIPTSSTSSPTAPLLNDEVRYRVNVQQDIDTFDLGIRVGDVIEYAGVDGNFHDAVVDELQVAEFYFRFRSDQPAPEVGDALRIRVHNPATENRFAIRTTDPTQGIAMQVGTVLATAVDNAPVQLAEDLTVRVSFDGGSAREFTIPASSTADNTSPEDMAASVNSALSSAGLDARLFATVAGSSLRLLLIDSAFDSIVIEGASALGFAASQSEDSNVARTELGLAAGTIAAAEFRVTTIQDLVYTVNTLIARELDGSPVGFELDYDETEEAFRFKLDVRASFSESIDLNFKEGFDLGFTEFEVAGGGTGVFSAEAGATLTVGLDLNRPGSGQAVDATTLLDSLDPENGFGVTVGITAQRVAPSSGRPSSTADLDLNLEVAHTQNALLFPGAPSGPNGSLVTSAIPLKLTSADYEDNTSLEQLATLFNLEIREYFVANGIPQEELVILPVEVQAADGKLIVIANDRVIRGMTIGTGTSEFLGFDVAQTGDFADLMITTLDGVTTAVNLDFATSLRDVKDAIDAVPNVTLEFGSGLSADGIAADQLRVIDSSTPSGESRFRIAAVSTTSGVSPAGSLLGLLKAGVDDAETEVNEEFSDNTLVSDPLLTGSLLDQFFIDTSVDSETGRPRSSVFANATVSASDINLVGAIGILDVGIIDGSGQFSIDASVDLQDADGKLRLSDLTSTGFNGTVTPNFDYGGEIDLPVAGSVVDLLDLDPQNAEDDLGITVSLTGSGFAKPTLTYDVSNFQAKLEGFKNFSLSDLAQVVQNLVDLLQNSNIEGLNTPVPVVNKTPNEILDIVDSLAAAAQKLLAGPDLDLIATKVQELRGLLDGFVVSASQANDIDDQIRALEAAVNADHLFQLFKTSNGTPVDLISDPGASDAPSMLDSNASAGEVRDFLNTYVEPGLVQTVTGKRGGPYTVTFVGTANVEPLAGRSPTGLAIQTATITEGGSGSSEVQEIRFLPVSKMSITLARLQQTIAATSVSTTGRSDLLNKVDEIRSLVVSANTLGDFVGDILKDELGLPQDAFNLVLDFVDADDNAAGFQPTAIVGLDISKSVTEQVGFDFELPDLGPITASTDAMIDFTVGGDLDLDFGFRFDTFTPYLLPSTQVSLSAGIDSGLNLDAGIGGITGTLSGNLDLGRIVPDVEIPANSTAFELPSTPLNGVVMLYNTTTEQFLAPSQFSVDGMTVTLSSSATHPLEVLYAAESSGSTDGASIGVSVRTDVTPIDGNTIVSILDNNTPDDVSDDTVVIGAIPFSQVFSSSFRETFAFNSTGIATATLDAALPLGVTLDDAITVAFSLDHPGIPQLSFGEITNFFQNPNLGVGQLSLDQLIDGTRSVLDTIESGLKSDLLEQLPLIGEGVDLGQSFVGDLRGVVDQIETVLQTADDAIDSVISRIQQEIFAALGPAGANILNLDPLFHDDPAVANAGETADHRDVEVFVSEILTSEFNDFEFFVNLSLAGRDTLDADFDLGLDAFVFELETQGGVEVAWDYAFDFGFGVSLQEGFFFQLNENVAYDNGELHLVDADSPVGLPTAAGGAPEIALSAEVNLKPGTSLAGELFFLNVVAESNEIEDYNRDGILNNGLTGRDPVSGLMQGMELNEAADNRDYNLDGDKNDILFETTARRIEGDQIIGRFKKGTGLTGDIFIDINDPTPDVTQPGDKGFRLTLSDLFKKGSFSSLFNAGITTEAFVDIGLKADTDLAGLPSIGADLTLDWAIGLTVRDGLVGGGLPDVALLDASIDVGSLFSTGVGEVFKSFNQYLLPVKPVIDFLAMPVPGLDDLSQLVSGPDITFLTMGILSTGVSKDSLRASKIANQVLGIIQNIFEFAEAVDVITNEADGVMINFGSFYLTGEPVLQTESDPIPPSGPSNNEFVLDNNPKAGTLDVFESGNLVDPANYRIVRSTDTGSLITKLVFVTTPAGPITSQYVTTGNTSMNLSDPDEEVAVDEDKLDTVEDPIEEAGNSPKKGAKKTKSTLKRLTGAADSNGNGGFGIKIPLLSDPSNVFKLFTGEKVDIIQWDIPTLSLEVPFRKEFGPIPFEPSPLFVTLGAQLDAVIDLSVGFDTRGIAKTDNFLDGLYFGDLENVTEGDDIPEIKIGLEASVGAAIKKGPFAAGLEGGIRADIDLNWNDLDGDGKLYLDEIVDLFSVHPEGGGGFPGICVFDADGALSAFLRAYLDTGVIQFDIDIVNEVFFRFSHSCPAPPIAELGDSESDVPSGQLMLLAGPNADARGPLYGNDINEEFSLRRTTVDETDDEGNTTQKEVVEVTFHYLNRDNDPDTVVRTYDYDKVREIYFAGGGGNDTLRVIAEEGLPTFDIPIRFVGGEGGDTFVGGAGNDIIIGGFGNDRLEGGLGSDQYVFGDRWGRDTVVEPANATNSTDVFDFSDVSFGLEVAYGSVSVTSGNNSVNGGQNEAGETVLTEGIERFIAGRGTDTLTVAEIVGAFDSNTWTLHGEGAGNINGEELFSFEGFENLSGGQQRDLFLIDPTDSLTGVIDGKGGEDTLDYSSFDSPVLANLEVGSANNIGGFIGINRILAGQSNDDSLTGSNSPTDWTISGPNRGSAGPIAFESFENLTGGESNDRFQVQADGRLSGKLLGTITPGKFDNDTVDFSATNVPVTFEISVTNTGTATTTSPRLNFESIESVTGSSASDIFHMAPDAELTGLTDGGDGDRDHLNFSAWNRSIALDLAAGENQGPGTVAGIEDVTGSASSDIIVGNDRSNRLIGLGGADTIDAKGGDNLVIGDSAEIRFVDGAIASIRTQLLHRADDTIRVGDGNNVILPGSGNDSVTAGNGPNVIGGDQVLVTLSGGEVVALETIGTDSGGRDVITTGTGPDYILAGNGNDTINDRGGNNVVIGDRGRMEWVNGLPAFAISEFSVDAGGDTVSTGNGRDAIIGGGGDDTVSAGDGDNYILGDYGQIRFVAGVPFSSTLSLTAADGNDTVTTLSGRDTIYTGGGDNTVLSGAGNDDVIGGSGIDQLNGQDGDDFLVGLLGDDAIDGGAGNDVLFGGLAIGTRADYELGTNDFRLPPQHVATEAIHPTGFFDSPRLLITPLIVTNALGEIVSQDGTAGDGRDILRGQDGNDVIFAGADSDELDGGAGIDFLDAGSGDDSAVNGGEGDDIVLGGFGNDVVNGDAGIDHLFGNQGDDTLTGGNTGSQVGQRLYGGDGNDQLFAFDPGTGTVAGDQLYGESGNDELRGGALSEILVGGSGNDQIAGAGADDTILGGSGEDILGGGDGNDLIFGGPGSDEIDGGAGMDKQFGEGGIDIFVINVDATAIDQIDGHFELGFDQAPGVKGFDDDGNGIIDDASEIGFAGSDDTLDDNATDIVSVLGTDGNDTILIGGTSVANQVGIRVARQLVPVQMLGDDGDLLVEQFRIAGLGGADVIGFYTVEAVQAFALNANAGQGLLPLDLSLLAERSDDFVGVFDGNGGNDLLLGSAGRDRLDGGLGSDLAWGFAGDDRLWGDDGGGTSNDFDFLFAGQGNDDLLGGQGENELFAWSLDPSLGEQFGVFVDPMGQLFYDDGDLNENGILDLDDAIATGPRRLPYVLETTGLNRMLGSENPDTLYGGTTLDFMYGNGGDDRLIRSDGSRFESADRGLGGNEWKEFARESDQVWYVGGTNAADRINVDFVTEPGLLTDHHLITRLTENNGNFSFAAQVRLDFSATDQEGNAIWSNTDLNFQLDELLTASDGNEKVEALGVIASDGSEPPAQSELIQSLVPPEGDFLVILVDALDGNDEINVGPTVQKNVWVDAGAGDDVVRIEAGNAILVDRAESSIGTSGRASRNDIAEQRFELFSTVAGNTTVFDGTVVDNGLVTFEGLSIDNPNDVDWYLFQPVETQSASATIELASGSPVDELGLAIFAVGSDVSDSGNRLNTASYQTTGDRSSISMAGLDPAQSYLLRVDSPNVVPTAYDLRFNLDGHPLDSLAASTIRELDTAIEMSLREDFGRRDVLLGGLGDDILQGGAGEDWVFGNEGNDVLIGGNDRQASDLMFGGPGDDTFQLIPDALPLLGSQPSTNFDPATETFIPTFSDQFIGGDGEDRVLFLGGDIDRRGFDVPDYASLRYNTLLHRYEFTSLVWDIGTQQFVTTIDGAGRDVFEQQYQFYQTRDVERTEFQLGNGDDVLRLDGEFKFLPLDLSGSVPVVDSSVDADRFEGWGIDRGDAEQGASESIVISAGNGNDVVFGSPYDDQISAGAGNDYVVGGLGNDQISGDGGSDRIFGFADPNNFPAFPFTPTTPAEFPVSDSERFEYVPATPFSEIDLDTRPGVDVSATHPMNIDSVAFGLSGSSNGELFSSVLPIGDFNGDGFQDFIASGDSQSYVAFGPVELTDLESIASFAVFVIDHQAVGIPALSFGDINGDGRDDLAFVKQEAFDTVVTVVFGNAIGRINPQDTTTTDQWPRLWDVDFANDFLVTSGNNANARRIRLESNASQAASGRLPLSTDGDVSIFITELTGDDQSDLFIASDSGLGSNEAEAGFENLAYFYTGKKLTGASRELQAIDLDGRVRNDGSIEQLIPSALGDTNGDGVEEIRFGIGDGPGDVLQVERVATPVVSAENVVRALPGITSTVTLTLNGTSATVSALHEVGDTATSLAAKLNSAIAESSLARLVFAEVVGGKLSFRTSSGGSSSQLTVFGTCVLPLRDRRRSRDHGQTTQRDVDFFGSGRRR